MENNGKPTDDHSKGVVVVRPAAEIMSRQRLPYYVGGGSLAASDQRKS